MDSVKPEDRGPSLAKLAASMMGGYLLGAGGGTIVAAFDGGIPAACWVSSIFAILISLAMSVIPEPKRTVKDPTPSTDDAVPTISTADGSTKADDGNDWKKVAKSPQWLTVAFVLFNNGLLFGALLTLSGQQLANVFHWSETRVAVTYLVNVVLLIGCNLFFYKPLVEKLGRRRFLTGALICGIILTLLMAVASEHNAWVFTLLVVSLFVAASQIVPTGTHIASELADRWSKNAQGRILGLTRAMFTIGQAVGPAIAGALAAVSYSLPWIVTCTSLGIGLVAHLVFGDRFGKDGSSAGLSYGVQRSNSWDIEGEEGGSTDIVEM